MRTKIICVYKITSPSGKIYIGSTVDFVTRVYQYKHLYCTSQVKLLNSFKRYGFEKHEVEIIEECGVDKIRERERHFAILFNSMGDKGLNLKIPKVNEGDPCFSDETKKRMSISRKGKVSSIETRKKLSISKMGNVPAMKGRKFTGQALENIKIGNRRKKAGWKLTEEQKNRLSIAQKKATHNPRFSKIILDTKTGVFYYSVKEAAEYVNIKAAYLAKRLTGLVVNKTSLIYA